MALTLFEDTFLLPNEDDYTVDFSPYFDDGVVPTYMVKSEFVVDILNREDIWNNASLQEKENALVAATIQSNYVTWTGSALTASQKLSWPREEITYTDPAYGVAATIQEGLIPDRVKLSIELTVLFILQHSFEGVNKFFPYDGAGEFTLKIDDVEYTDNTSSILSKAIKSLQHPFTPSPNFTRSN